MAKRETAHNTIFKEDHVVRIDYVESQSMTVQGGWNEVVRRYGKEWNIRPWGGGNGNWILTKRSDVLVDGESYRGFVLDHYGKSKLTRQLVERFRRDVENGVIKIS